MISCDSGVVDGIFSGGGGGLLGSAPNPRCCPVCMCRALLSGASSCGPRTRRPSSTRQWALFQSSLWSFAAACAKGGDNGGTVPPRPRTLPNDCDSDQAPIHTAWHVGFASEGGGGGGGGVNRAPKIGRGGVREKGSIAKHHQSVIMNCGTKGVENFFQQ